MDGGQAAFLDVGKDFKATPRSAEAEFVSQPGLKVPDEHSSFQPLSPFAMAAAACRAEHMPEADGAPVLNVLADAVEAPAQDVSLVGVPEPVMPRHVAPSAAQLAEVRAAAMAEGRALGLAEAQAELAGERAGLAAQAKAMVSALAQLAQPPIAEVDALTHTIAEAVARLASERAGQVIDTHPDLFAHRIANLAERVAQGMRDVTIRLHPDDLSALLPVLSEACPAELATLASARLIPSAALMRGDADLRAPGIRLADLIGHGDVEPPFEDSLS